VRPWRWLAVTAALFGLSAVILAALGAHAVPLPQAESVRLWGTAQEMHLFHSAAMLAMAALAARHSSSSLAYSGLVMAVGTMLFSGSLYLRAAGLVWFPAFLAPAGGMLQIASWIWLTVTLLRQGRA